MAVMRSIMYVPGNNPKMVEKAPSIPADIITLDLEDSVPPSEKEAARKLVAEKLKYAGSGGAQVYVRINNWETEMTNDDLEAVVWEGLDGVTLAKTGHPDDVKRLDWKLEELERRRGIPVGTVKISMLLETAKGIMNAYECCLASSRNVNAIFGAVDYCRDMRVKLTSEAVEQMWGRAKMAIAARAAGIVAIDAPFVAYQDIPAFERNVMEGKQMGYEGRMIIHPSQVEPSNRLYAPDPADVEWANGVVKVFEEEGLAKGKAAVSYLGKMVDTPVYLNAKDILAAQAEIDAKVKKVGLLIVGARLVRRTAPPLDGLKGRFWALRRDKRVCPVPAPSRAGMGRLRKQVFFRGGGGLLRVLRRIPGTSLHTVKAGSQRQSVSSVHDSLMRSRFPAGRKGRRNCSLIFQDLGSCPVREIRSPNTKV